MNGFGKANFGGGKRNWFKIKDGDNVYRILPPIGDLREEGRWSFYHKVHYGYRNSKNEMRTFLSPEVKNHKTKMTEVRDAALDRINDIKAKIEEAKKAGNDAMVTKLQEFAGGQKSRYNLDANHYLNVIDLQGNIGILKIRHKAKLALDAVIKKLRDQGVEPLDPESGRYFVFTRSGAGRDTLYSVSTYKKKMTIPNVGEVEQEVVHTITDDVAKRCFSISKDGKFTYKEAARLDTLFRKLSEEEVARIVREGEKAVDEIFDTKASPNEPVEHDDSGPEDDEPISETQATPGIQQQAQAAVNPTAYNAASTENPQTPKVVTTTPVAAVQVTTPAPAAPVPAAAPKTTAQAVSEQTDEEFLKNLGL